MAPIEVRPNRERGVQFPIGAVLQHSNTPSLRVAGFEDENEAPHGGDYSGLSIVSRFTSVAFGSRKIRGGLPEITWYAVKTNSG